MLDIPHFKETNDEKKRSNFWNIFGSDPKKQEEHKAERQNKAKEKPNINLKTNAKIFK